MIDSFERLFEQTRPGFCQERTFQRARTLAMSALVGLGRRTISGMLCASSQQFNDWSAAYRLFEQERFCVDQLFAPARRETTGRLKEGEPLVVMMDDTLIRKRGRKVHGSGWRRDPLGPPFCSNFVWGQRFLQISAALPETEVAGRARGIPIDLTHAPSAIKPKRKATDQAWTEYKNQQQLMKVSSVGISRLHALRSSMDQDNQGRPLIACVDGGFTNRTVFRKLPHNTVAIGRIRKDARLFMPPSSDRTKPSRGRHRFYGTPLPTPEQLRRDETMQWEVVSAFAAGKIHSFEVKTIAPVRWIGTGAQDVRLVVIRPLAYRPRKGSPLLYRDPVYLICTDPDLPLDRLLQAYLWRWEIELNFRDEKTVLGLGEAQVRTKSAVETVPALMVASYAFLLLAGTNSENASPLPPPKWRTPDSQRRISTAGLLGALRSQLWGKAMGLNLNHFANHKTATTKPLLFENALQSAVCYAIK